MGASKPLNSIIAIAVILIITTHWLDTSSLSLQLGIDGIGINMLFVISCFTITRLLLERREESEQFGIPRSKLIANFYGNGALKIFPIYYLLIVALLIYFLTKNVNSTSEFYYYLSFTSNFYFYKQHVFTGPIPHVWALAVGVQFYLIWPLLILFVDKKYLLTIFIGVIVIGIITQFVYRSVSLSHLLPFTCFDCFGFGALLAWVVVYKPAFMNNFYKGASIAALVSLIVYGLFIYQGLWKVTNLRTCTGIISLWILTFLYRNDREEKSKFSFFLFSPLLLFLGKISYGLYLYHLIIPLLVDNDFFWFTINAHLPNALLDYLLWFYFGECAIILFVVSVLSYFIIEKPIFSLQKYFRPDQLRPVTQNP